MAIYRHIPSQKTVFKVNPGCCFDRVVYDGEIGIAGKNNRTTDVLNSWDLECEICNPKLFIECITEAQYEAIRSSAMAQMNKA